MQFQYLFENRYQTPGGYAILNMSEQKRCYFLPYNLQIDAKLDTYSTISFDVPYYHINDVTKEKYPNLLYPYMECLRTIHIDGVGFFQINSVDLESDGYMEQKKITAYSAEYNLTRRFLPELKIRIDGKGNDIILYNPKDPEHSLMHKVLAGTDWSVRYCNPELASLPIVLDLERTSIYDIITDDIANFCECRVIFNIEKLEVNFYNTQEYGHSTNIVLTFDNLMQNADITYQEDNIKTSLWCEGNDINIRDINGGDNSIIDLSYYATGKWMGESLAGKYNKYKQLRNERLPYYTEISKYLTVFNIRHNAIINNRPDDGMHSWQTLTSKEWNEIDNSMKLYYDLIYQGQEAAYALFHTKGIGTGLNDSIYCGISFLQEGITMLDNLLTIEDHKKDRNDNRINYYKGARQAYEAKKETLEEQKSRIEDIQEYLSFILEVLNEYFSYHGFTDDHAHSQDPCIFDADSGWEVDPGFDQLFQHDELVKIISQTVHFSYIWGEFSNSENHNITENVDGFDSSNAIKLKGNNLYFNNLIRPFHNFTFVPAFKNPDIKPLPFIQEKLGLNGEKWFTPAEIQVLKSFELEDSYTDSNFKLQKNDTKADILKKSQRLYNNGLTKLSKMCQPTLSFSAEIANPFIAKAYRWAVNSDVFSLGNTISVIMRNDSIITAELNEMHIDFSDPENSFSFTYSNASADRRFSDIHYYINKLSNSYQNARNISYANLKMSDIENNIQLVAGELQSIQASVQSLINQ